MSDWIDRVVEILFEGSFMTLATADADGVLWATPVEFACDEQLRFYRVSMVDTRHSHNVEVRPRAAFSIYDSTQLAGAGIVQGLYGEGPVEELDRAELEEVAPILARWIRWRDRDRATPRPTADGEGDDAISPWRHHRIDPTRLYALDPSAGAESFDSRVPVDLSDVFNRAYRTRIA